MIALVARLVDSIVAVHREIVALEGEEEPAPLPAGASDEAVVSFVSELHAARTTASTGWIRMESASLDT